MLFDIKNIKCIIKDTYRRVRSFLLAEKGREFLTFLFFVLISFGFWMLQTLDDIYQTEFTIPMRLKNVPKDIIITSELQDEVRIRVEDRGTVLLNYMLGRSFFPVSFDFSDYENMGAHIHIPQIELSKKVAAQLNPTTKLLSINPDSIGFVYSKGVYKKVPVAVSGKITAGMQYYISGIKTVPDSVTVYAPQDVLNTINTAYTASFDHEGLTEGISSRVSLSRVNGAKFEPSVCDVSVSVDMYSEKTVEVPIKGIGFPPGKSLRTFPSKVQVSFLVGLTEYSSVSAGDFDITVDFNELSKLKDDKVSLQVKTTNKNITHIKVIPSAVDYLIEETTYNTLGQ